ncbi:MAG: hypothetical protein CH6_3211 [Candidatus Kapaibacterium sp.]|nr:MAG: hypothetical protein CH6_3211 [Candidatus Kapabacteria bacterium]
MKRLVNSAVLLFTIFSLAAFAQKSDVVTLKWSGYVKTDVLFDSRQIDQLREGHFSIIPKKEILDADNKDINAKPNFNILSIQTRLAGTIIGPDVLGAKSMAYFETEFFGSTDATINTLRLRHAFLKFTWDNFEFLAGQYWHPMFVVECYPGVVGFNTGAPFQPFIRSPQLRFVTKFDPVKVILTAASQRDFQSPGPDGNSTTYLRNAVIPNLNAQVQINLFGSSLIGGGVDFKQLAPRIKTASGKTTDETIDGLSFIGFMKLAFGDFSFKAEGVLGENLTEMIMLGGYAVKDATQDKWEYTPNRNLSLWADISYGKDVEYGIFGGYSKNLGTKDNYQTFFGRNEDVADLIRVSPRIQFTLGKVKISGEVEIMNANFGTPDRNDKGKVNNTKSVTNVRGQIAFMYIF